MASMWTKKLFKFLEEIEFCLWLDFIKYLAKAVKGKL